MDDGAGPEVLLVGLDAACSRVVDPLLESGAIPNLATLLDAGTSGSLDSQIPPWTPSAWPSLFTGVNPGKHGVFGFLNFEGYDWSVVNHTHVRERSLWELLDENDRSSVVVNVPVTHPPRPIDGAVVPGYTAPEDPDCHPEGLLSEIRDTVGEYRVYAPDPSGRDERIEWYRRLTRMRGRAFRYLCERFEPDFGFVQFQQTDTVFHELPGDPSAVESVYAAVDEQVGKILDEYDPELVVVASDHGMGPYDGHEFRANDFLHEQGFLKTTTDGDGTPSWSSVAVTEPEDDNNTETPSVVERAFTGAARMGITSQRLQKVLSTVGLADVALRLAPASIVRAAAEDPDYPASRAYMRDRIECGVRLNLSGREPNGQVSKDEYDTVRDDLIERLRDVETPDGKPVFERVTPRETVYDGPYVEEAPDIITVPREFDEFLSTTIHGETFGQPTEPYNHKFEGLVAVDGPEIGPDATVEGANLFDIAPTILSALDVPRSDRMDGSPLAVVTPTEERSYPRHTTDAQPGVSAGEAVENRLEDLGYIE